MLKNVNISSLYTRVRTTVALSKRVKKHYGSGHQFKTTGISVYVSLFQDLLLYSQKNKKVEKCSLQRQVDQVYRLLQMKTDLLRQKTVIINNTKTKLKRQDQTIRKLKIQISENDAKREVEYMKLLQSKKKLFENLSEVIEDSKMEI